MQIHFRAVIFAPQNDKFNFFLANIKKIIKKLDQTIVNSITHLLMQQKNYFWSPKVIKTIKFQKVKSEIISIN